MAHIQNTEPEARQAATGTPAAVTREDDRRRLDACRWAGEAVDSKP